LAKQPTQPDLRSNLGLSLALTGNIDNALTLLKPLLGANGTEARHRQTLAMVHGLAGDQTSAREIASIDLTPRAIEQNLAFYETIRKMEDPTKRLKAIRAHMAQ
jgi:Flp pilus assembly protein TadD